MGCTFSHGLTEVLALQFIEQTGSSVLVRGHGGELAKLTLAWPLHTDEAVHSMTGIPAFVTYMAARANYLTPNVPVDHLLTPRPPPGPVEAASIIDRADVGRRAGSRRGVCVPVSPRASPPLHRPLPRTVPDQNRRQAAVRRSRLPAGPAQCSGTMADDTSIHRALVAAGNPALLRVRNRTPEQRSTLLGWLRTRWTS